MKLPQFKHSQLVQELEAAGITQLKLVAPLGMGTSNQNFLANSHGESWVLRVNNPLTNKLCPRDNEVACWRIAEAAGLAPELKFVSQDFRYYLSRYIDTEKTWQQQHQCHPRAAQLLGQLLGKLSKLALPKHRVTPRSQWCFYQKEIVNRSAKLRPLLQTVAKEILALDSRVEAIINRLEQTQSLRFCHRDLNPHNLLLEKNRLLCIDFEYACSSDPRLELAAMLAHHKLGDSQQDWLIQDQLKGVEQERHQTLQDANFLYWLFTACWALIMCDDGKGAQSWYENAMIKIRRHEALITR
ncbi:hypothetical protein R50072_06970 [Simiduia litorea]|uniref:phosphotransferase n=1 Tax=Simiduia litorea TaxID=1435348 RepID=UPI0036F3EC0F